MAIVVKVLKNGSPKPNQEVRIVSSGLFGGQKAKRTGFDGICQFFMSPGSYTVYINGKCYGKQMLTTRESVFHI